MCVHTAQCAGWQSEFEAATAGWQNLELLLAGPLGRGGGGGGLYCPIQDAGMCRWIARSLVPGGIVKGRCPIASHQRQLVEASKLLEFRQAKLPLGARLVAGSDPRGCQLNVERPCLALGPNSWPLRNLARDCSIVRFERRGFRARVGSGLSFGQLRNYHTENRGNNHHQVRIGYVQLDAKRNSPRIHY